MTTEIGGFTLSDWQDMSADHELWLEKAPDVEADPGGLIQDRVGLGGALKWLAATTLKTFNGLAWHARTYQETVTTELDVSFEATTSTEAVLDIIKRKTPKGLQEDLDTALETFERAWKDVVEVSHTVLRDAADVAEELERDRDGAIKLHEDIIEAWPEGLDKMDVATVAEWAESLLQELAEAGELDTESQSAFYAVRKMRKPLVEAGVLL